MATKKKSKAIKKNATHMGRGSTALAVHMCFAYAFLLWRVPNCTQAVIQEVLGISVTTCKRQLAMLTETFGVEFGREGGLKYGYYVLLDSGILELDTLFPFLKEHQPLIATRIERYFKKHNIALIQRKPKRKT